MRHVRAGPAPGLEWRSSQPSPLTELRLSDQLVASFGLLEWKLSSQRGRGPNPHEHGKVGMTHGNMVVDTGHGHGHGPWTWHPQHAYVKVAACPHAFFPAFVRHTFIVELDLSLRTLSYALSGRTRLAPGATVARACLGTN